MTSWIVDALDTEGLDQARIEASRRLLNQALSQTYSLEDDANLCFMYEALELAVIDLLDDREQIDVLRTVSADAFQLLRVMRFPETPLDAGKTYLKLACLGVLGDRVTDASRLLKESTWPTLPIDSSNWGERTYSIILEIWLRLIRKDGWEDLDIVLERVISLREQQSEFEEKYLNESGVLTRTAAWELVVLYHLAKAAELQVIYTTQGKVDGHFDIRQQLEAQFDRALIACSRAELIELDILTRLLARTAQQMVDNCIWSVTRAVNSRVTNFVKNLVSREQLNPIFEMLPPQRHSLREAGLLGSSHRSVVVNLPTSSGKTFIAKFRILQALNQFDQEQGWVVYIAPTRALVNQVCMSLRRDFTPLGINVERVSPALEVDGMEASILSDVENTTHFRVLVSTPEKLDMLLRGGWEEKIGRPLTLVVVDEAHNLSQSGRGIKLELLLATINRECGNAQFLLLTPFIPNADEIAKWLSPDSNINIQLGLNWKPNDRAIVLSQPQKGVKRGSFSLNIETISSNDTLSIPEILSLNVDKPLSLNWSDVKNNSSKLASATAQALKERGPVIILAGKITHTWSLAENFIYEENRLSDPDEDIRLVQRYLKREFGEDFKLCELLEYGIGVHHAGLSDEARILMEWLFERGHIKVLVATTTIAQGVNFPVAGVVLASHQYPYGKDMPPADFWNLAGRAGRVEQGSIGIIALAATDDAKAAKLRQFVERQVLSLNSTLIDMVNEAMKTGEQLELHRLFNKPEWSSFLQYLAHTYRQIGDPEDFANQIELVLRGTLGFEKLRQLDPYKAQSLILSVETYAERLAGHPLKLVDSTGFSWETVSITLRKLSEERIRENIWDPEELFGDGRSLQTLMGILLSVPELRDNLEAATGGHGPDGNRLSLMIRDWVNGTSLPEMAEKYFKRDANGNEVDSTRALTNCCKNIFGKLTQTAAWGLAALQTMTFGDNFDQLTEAEQETLRNLPARVFYGVNNDDAIALRLLGVPREATQDLIRTLGDVVSETPLPQLRTQLSESNGILWSQAMGDTGRDYYKIWRILEGLGEVQ